MRGEKRLAETGYLAEAKLDPGRNEAYFRLASLYRHAERYDEALTR